MENDALSPPLDNPETFRQQIAVPEQRVVLRGLVQSCAKEKMRVLEVGSWCGDSTVEIGTEVKKHGGHLYCIDWWKGNPGTNLEKAALQTDIYLEFWNRIIAEGLDDTVIPIRGKSDDISPILANETFDMVYIDADHRYPQVERDILNYAKLIMEGGILCGDDCEGRLHDFDLDFLEAGKYSDFHETVHCGVVLSVGNYFSDYSLDFSIWSVRRHEQRWIPTNVEMKGILRHSRQSHPPLIESYKEHNLIRYGKDIFAIPWRKGAIDITLEADRKRPGILVANSIIEAKALIDTLV